MTRGCNPAEAEQPTLSGRWKDNREHTEGEIIKKQHYSTPVSLLHWTVAYSPKHLIQEQHVRRLSPCHNDKGLSCGSGTASSGRQMESQSREYRRGDN